MLPNSLALIQSSRASSPPQDPSTQRLTLSSWLFTSKSGTVSRRTGADAHSQLRRLRDRLVTGATGATPVAQAFGFDGLGQGVPPQGLDNLLGDLEAGSLQGITMLQARVKLGPRPAGHFAVEYSLDNTPAGSKAVLRARLANGEAATAAATQALRAVRDDLQSSAKRMIITAEAVRRVKITGAEFEFVVDSSGACHCVGCYGVKSTLADGEMSPEMVAAAELEILQLTTALMQQQAAAAVADAQTNQNLAHGASSVDLPQQQQSVRTPSGSASAGFSLLAAGAGPAAVEALQRPASRAAFDAIADMVDGSGSSASALSLQQQQQQMMAEQPPPDGGQRPPLPASQYRQQQGNSSSNNAASASAAWPGRTDTAGSLVSELELVEIDTLHGGANGMAGGNSTMPDGMASVHTFVGTPAPLTTAAMMDFSAHNASNFQTVVTPAGGPGTGMASTDGGNELFHRVARPAASQSNGGAGDSGVQVQQQRQAQQQQQQQQPQYGPVGAGILPFTPSDPSHAAAAIAALNGQQQQLPQQQQQPQALTLAETMSMVAPGQPYYDPASHRLIDPSNGTSIDASSLKPEILQALQQAQADAQSAAAAAHVQASMQQFQMQNMQHVAQFGVPMMLPSPMAQLDPWKQQQQIAAMMAQQQFQQQQLQQLQDGQDAQRQPSSSSSAAAAQQQLSSQPAEQAPRERLLQQQQQRGGATKSSGSASGSGGANGSTGLRTARAGGSPVQGPARADPHSRSPSPAPVPLAASLSAASSASAASGGVDGGSASGKGMLGKQGSASSLSSLPPLAGRNTNAAGGGTVSSSAADALAAVLEGTDNNAIDIDGDGGRPVAGHSSATDQAYTSHAATGAPSRSKKTSSSSSSSPRTRTAARGGATGATGAGRAQAGGSKGAAGSGTGGNGPTRERHPLEPAPQRSSRDTSASASASKARRGDASPPRGSRNDSRRSGSPSRLNVAGRTQSDTDAYDDGGDGEDADGDGAAGGGDRDLTDDNDAALLGLGVDDRENVRRLKARLTRMRSRLRNEVEAKAALQQQLLTQQSPQPARPSGELLRLLQAISAPASSSSSSSSASASAASSASSSSLDEEVKVPDGTDRSELVQAIHLLQSSLRGAISEISRVESRVRREVHAAEAKEHEDTVRQLQQAHRNELLGLKTAFEVLEQENGDTKNELNLARIALMDTANREAIAGQLAQSLAIENARIVDEMGKVQAVVAERSQAAAEAQAQLQRLQQQVQQQQQQQTSTGATGSSNINQPPSRRTSFSTRTGLGSKVGAQIISGSSHATTGAAGAVGATASLGSDELQMSSSPTGLDVIGKAADALNSGSSVMPSRPASATATGPSDIKIRQLQLEVESLRTTLASELSARQELSTTNAKLLDEFKVERRKLKQQISQLEDAERQRVGDNIVIGASSSSSALAQNPRPGTKGGAGSGGARSRSPTAGGRGRRLQRSDTSDRPGSPDHSPGRGASSTSSAAGIINAAGGEREDHLGIALQKTRESEALQVTIAALRSELASTQASLQSALGHRMETSGKLDTVMPLNKALEAEVSALKSENSALRKIAQQASGSLSPAAAALLNRPGSGARRGSMATAIAGVFGGANSNSNGTPRQSRTSTPVHHGDATVMMLSSPAAGGVGGGTAGPVRLFGDDSSSSPAGAKQPSSTSAARSAAAIGTSPFHAPASSSSASSTLGGKVDAEAQVNIGDEISAAIIAAEVAVRDAAAEKAVAESNVLRNELLVLQQMTERLAIELKHAGEQMDGLKTEHQRAIDDLQSKAAVAKDAALRELSSKHEARSKQALDNGIEQLSRMYDNRIESLQKEVAALSQQLQSSIGESASLKEQTSSLSKALADARARLDAPPPAPSPEDDLNLLKPELAAARSIIDSLRTEVLMTRQAADTQLSEINAQYAERIAQLQSAQQNMVMQAERDAEDRSAMRLQAAVTEVSQAMAGDVRQLQDASQEAVERSLMASEETRSRLLDASEQRLASVLVQLETEVQGRLQTAVTDAVSAARTEWEAATHQAIAAMRDGDAKSASEMAQAMAQAARREVETEMLQHIRGLEEQLTNERAAIAAVVGAERAAAQRSATESSIALNELRSELTKSQESIVLLKSRHASELDALRQQERLERESTIKSMATSNEQSLKSALDGARTQLSAMYDARVASLQGEISALSKQLQAGIEEASTLREQAASMAAQAAAAAAAAAAASAAAAAAPKWVDPADDPALLKPQLAAAASQIAALRQDIVSIRTTGEQQLSSMQQEFASNLSQVQSQHEQQCQQVQRQAEAEGIMRLQAAVAEISNTMAVDVNRLQDTAREAIERAHLEAEDARSRLVAASESRMNLLLTQLETEVQVRLQTAVVDAVQAARQEWESATEAAIAVMRDGEQRTASEVAQHMALAARREVESTLGNQIRDLQQQIAAGQDELRGLRQEVTTRESYITSLQASIQQQAIEMQAVQAVAVATADRNARDQMGKQLQTRLSEAASESAKAIQAVIAEWSSKVAKVEAEARTTLEQRLAAQEKTLRESHKAALETAAASKQQEMGTVVNAALSEMQLATDDNARKLNELQAEAAAARATLMMQHNTEVRMLQQQLQELRVLSLGHESAAARAAEAHASAVEQLQSSHASKVRELESLISSLRQEQEVTATRVQETFDQLKRAAVAEVEAVRNQAGDDITHAIAAAQASALGAVEEQIRQARDAWQAEMDLAVQQTMMVERNRFNEELQKLASATDMTVAQQADLFQKGEQDWITRVNAMQESHAKEVERLSLLLSDARAAAEAEKAALQSKMADAASGAEARLRDTVEKLQAEAAADRQSLEQRLKTAKASAVKTAVEKALAEASTRFEAERETFRAQSKQLTDSVIEEANKLVESAQAEAARDKAAALEALRAQHTAELERVASDHHYAESAIGAERQAALQALQFAHSAELTRLSTQISQLNDQCALLQEQMNAAVDKERRVAEEQRSALLSESEGRLKDIESAWSQRCDALQRDNEQAAAIIAGLLKEADDASRRASDLTASLAASHESHAREVSERVAQYEAAMDTLRTDTHARISSLESALMAGEERLQSELSTAAAEWVAERTRIEERHATERDTYLGFAQQVEGAAIAGVEQMQAQLSAVQEAEAQRLQAMYDSDMAGLRQQHEQEMESLRTLLNDQHRDEIDRLTRDAETRAAEAVALVRKEASDAAEKQVLDLEQVVKLELGQRTKEVSTSSAVAIQQVKEQHAKEVEALRNSYNSRVAAASGELEAAQLLAAQQVDAMRHQFETEVAAIREQSVPLSVVSDLRDKMEAEALAALQAAVAEAVLGSRQEAEALQEVLRQRIAEQEADRKQLSAQLDVIQEAVTSQMDAASASVRASEERAERASMYAEDVAEQLRRHYSSEAVSGQILAATQAAEGWLQQQLQTAQIEMEDAIQQRSQEMQAAVKAESEAFGAIREHFSSEVMQLQEQLQLVEQSKSEAIRDRDAQIQQLRFDLEDITAKAHYAQTTALEELRMGMRQSFEAERAASEGKSREALAQAVTEAVAAGIASKEDEITKLKAEYASQFADFERAAADMQDQLKRAMESRHKSEMESAFQSALIDRDMSVERVRQEKEWALMEATRIANGMVEQAMFEHEQNIATLRQMHEEEKRALAERAGSDVSQALDAAKSEMQNLLGAADQAWQEKAMQMLAAQSEQHSLFVAEIQEHARRHLETVTAGFERDALAMEEARHQLIALHAAAVEIETSRARAEGEADKIGSLGAFNAEWVARLEARVSELMADRESELAAVRSEYQSQIDSTVVQLEQQRQAALSAFAAEADAERTRALEERMRAVAEAVDNERSIAARQLADAMQRAREDMEQALAEQASKLAEERAKAIDAVRQQATEEQEEAMDALRVESERLLGSIEGAMTKLRDERDIAGEDAHQLQAALDKEKENSKRLRSLIAGLKRSGVVSTLKQYLLAGRYVSTLDRVQRDAEARRMYDLNMLNGEWADKYAVLEGQLEGVKAKMRVLIGMRHAMQETLTSFKREMLMQHKVKSTQLAQELASLSEAKAEASKASNALGSQVAEVEGSIRAIEKEMQELSKQSVIDKDGSVNVALTRKKKRLDRDMDTALVKISDRKAAVNEVDRKIAEIEGHRTRKEEELKQVEAGLVATLVQQQRKLMQVLSSVPLPAEDLEMAVDMAQMGLEGLQAVANNVAAAYNGGNNGNGNDFGAGYGGSGNGNGYDASSAVGGGGRAAEGKDATDFVGDASQLMQHGNNSNQQALQQQYIGAGQQGAIQGAPVVMEGPPGQAGWSQPTPMPQQQQQQLRPQSSVRFAASALPVPPDASSSSATSFLDTSLDRSVNRSGNNNTTFNNNNNTSIASAGSAGGGGSGVNTSTSGNPTRVSGPASRARAVLAKAALGSIANNSNAAAATASSAALSPSPSSPSALVPLPGSVPGLGQPTVFRGRPGREAASASASATATGAYSSQQQQQQQQQLPTTGMFWGQQPQRTG